MKKNNKKDPQKDDFKILINRDSSKYNKFIKEPKLTKKLTI